MITILLILANLLAYVAELAFGGQSVCEAYGLVPAHAHFDAIFTSMFLHDPAIMAHLGGNMVFLAVFGTIVEREIGRLRFLVLYLAAGVGGALLHILVNPVATEALVGASGAIYGVMAVVAVLRPRLLGLVGAFAVLNIWYALTGTGGSVSFGDHLGGFAVGALFVASMRLREKMEAVT